MRLLSCLAGLAASVLVAVSTTTPAMAWGYDPSVAPERPERREALRRWSHGDPYAYRYVRRGYYPYYGSHYWVPAAQMRYRYRTSFDGPKIRYQSSWGRPRHGRHMHPARTSCHFTAHRACHR